MRGITTSQDPYTHRTTRTHPTVRNMIQICQPRDRSLESSALDDETTKYCRAGEAREEATRGTRGAQEED